MKRIIPLTCAIVLGACSSLVTSSIGALSQLDPLTADPDDVAVKIEAPEGLAIRSGSALLRLSAERDGQIDSGTFVLQSDGDVWFIAPQDRPTLRALQSRIAVWEAEDPDGTRGQLGISIDPCFTGGPLAAEATGSVFLRTEAEGTFLPLIKDAPVRDLLEDEDIPACT